MRRIIPLLLLSASALTAGADGRYVDTLPAVSAVVEGYSREQAERRLTQEPLLPVEGLWRLTSDGGLISVERWTPDDRPADGGTYLRILVVRAARRAIRPGTVMGYMSPTAQPDTFDACLYTGIDDGATLSGPCRYLITLKDDALQFRKVNTGLKVKWPRLLPYPLRRAIIWQSEDRDGLDGCTRLRPATPRYF